MSTSIYLTDSFQRGTTAVNGTAGSTSGVGNGWIDRVGGVWNLSSNVVKGGNAAQNYATNWLVRPTSENSLNQRMVATFAPPTGTNTTPISLLRVNSASDNAYAAFLDGGTGTTSILHIAALINGANTSLGTLSNVPFNNTHSYILDFKATANATAGTDLVATVYDAAAPGTSIGSVTVTGDTTSALQSAGSYGIAAAGTTVFNGLNSIVLYNGVTTPQLSVGPGSASVSTASATVPLAVNLSNSSASLAASVTGGGTISTASPASGSTLTYTAPANGTGTATVTVTDATDSITKTSSIAYAGPSSGTMSIAPNSVPLGQVSNITVQGTGTSWTSSTTLTVSGGTNAAFSNLSVNASTQTMTATFWPGSTVATITVGDSADSITTTLATTANITNYAQWDGDSLSYGQNGSNPGTASATRLAVTLNGMGPSWSGGNTGVQGQTLVQMLGRVPTYVTANYQSGKTNWLFAQGGHNDINQGANAATVIARIQSYIAAVLAGNPAWKIIWSTEPPAAYPGYPALFDSIRDAVNAYMRANWKALGIYALCDFALDQMMGQDGQEYNATYYSSSDRTHPTDAGYTVWGRYELATVQNTFYGAVGSGSISYNYS